MSKDNTKVEKNSTKKTKGFQKGHKKTGGRQKGTPNKKTLGFIDKLGNFDTVKELTNLFNITEDESLKFSICKEFLKYEYPQRKAVDFEVGAEGLNLIEAANKIKEALCD